MDVFLLFLGPSFVLSTNKVEMQKQDNEVEKSQRLRLANEKTELLYMERQENLTETESLFRDALAIRVAIHEDENHPEVVESMLNLAVFLSSQSDDDVKWMEANALFGDCLKRRQSITSGDALLDTLNIKRDYGNFLIKQRRIYQGEQLLNESYQGYRDGGGKDNPVTFKIMSDLVNFYRVVVPERIHEAEKMQEDVFVHSEEVLGELHADTLKEMHVLASIYAAQSKNEPALSLYTECLEKRTKVLGIHDPLTLLTMYDLALLQHAGRKDLAAAESLYVSCMNGQQRVLGDTHRDTLQTMSNLASLYKQMVRALSFSTLSPYTILNLLYL